jgi:hypothetical protein
MSSDEKPLTTDVAPLAIPVGEPAVLEEVLASEKNLVENVRLVEWMTLPASETHPDVLEFLNLWNLRDPIYVDYQDVGEGYRPDFCHVSVKHVALNRGGRRIHGWALWQFSQGGVDVIVADFHSVWETPDGVLVDVTLPKDGNKVLFVRDPELVITRVGNVQRLYNNRTNVPDAPRLWNGNPTGEEFFGMPDDQPSLVAYCAQLGLPNTSME